MIHTIDVLCPECGQPAIARAEDFGIGPYEFWGARYIDTDVHLVTDCCGVWVDAQAPDEGDLADDAYERMRDRMDWN